MGGLKKSLPFILLLQKNNYIKNNISFAVDPGYGMRKKISKILIRNNNLFEIIEYLYYTLFIFLFQNP